MDLRPPSVGSSMLRCEYFGRGCSFLVAKSSVGKRRGPNGDRETTGVSSELVGCPECSGELIGVKQGL